MDRIGHKIRHYMNACWNRFRTFVLKGLVLFVLSVASVSISNNGVYPFSDNFPLIEFLTVLFGGFILVLLYEWLYSSYFRTKLIKNFQLHTFVQFLILCLGITLVCYPMYYYYINQSLLSGAFYFYIGLIQTMVNSFVWLVLVYGIDIYNSSEKNKTNKKIAFKKNNGTVYLRPEYIAGAYIQNQIVYVITMNGSRIPVEHTLNDMEEKLAKFKFYRISRQYILKKSSIHSIERGTNQKLKLKTIPILDLPNPITVSRYKADKVRSWLNDSFS